jgi:hypothetical protein
MAFAQGVLYENDYERVYVSQQITRCLTFERDHCRLTLIRPFLLTRVQYNTFRLPTRVIHDCTCPNRRLPITKNWKFFDWPQLVVPRPDPPQVPDNGPDGPDTPPASPPRVVRRLYPVIPPIPDPRIYGELIPANRGQRPPRRPAAHAFPDDHNDRSPRPIVESVRNPIDYHEPVLPEGHFDDLFE